MGVEAARAKPDAEICAPPVGRQLHREGEVRVDKRDLAYRSELSGCEIEDALAGLCRIGLITLLAADGVATSRARYRLACEPATGGEG